MKNKRYSQIVSLVCFILLFLIVIICTMIKITSNENKAIETSYRTYIAQAGDEKI